MAWFPSTSPNVNVTRKQRITQLFVFRVYSHLFILPVCVTKGSLPCKWPVCCLDKEESVSERGDDSGCTGAWCQAWGCDFCLGVCMMDGRTVSHKWTSDGYLGTMAHVCSCTYRHTCAGHINTKTKQKLWHQLFWSVISKFFKIIPNVSNIGMKDWRFKVLHNDT